MKNWFVFWVCLFFVLWVFCVCVGFFSQNIKLFTLSHFNIYLKWGRIIAVPSFLISVTFQCVCVWGGVEEPIFFFLGLREGKNVRRREYYESGQIYHSTRTHGEWVEWGNTTKMDMHDLTMSIPKISCKDGRINSLFNTVYRCTEQTKSSIIIPCLSDSSLKIGV